jgi:hypothetical protein
MVSIIAVARGIMVKREAFKREKAARLQDI